ncbi:MAG TPA: FAD-dependent oxidoreductase, partial [bacterium]|nr:FAD-dependent oxidoreductase [bacterium]
MLYDVVVAGLGPAGATAAYECARRGLRVLALDKALMPRHKPCGGAISSRIDAVLGDGFHEVVEGRIREVMVSFQGRDSFRVSSPETVAYLVRRERFDLYLCERAQNNGVEVILGEEVVGFEPLSESVRVRTTRTSYQGKYLIGADGALGVIGRQLGLWPPHNPWIAMEGEIDFPSGIPGVVPGEIRLDFGTAPFGYGWGFPKNMHMSLGVFGSSAKIKGIHRLYDESISHMFPLKEFRGGCVQGWI